MRRLVLVPLLVVACRKPHHVVLEATADPHPASCRFHVVANSSRGPLADVTVEGRRWNSGDVPSDVGESFAVTVSVESSTPDPACDVGVSCRLLVDGVEKRAEIGARRVLCSQTVR